MTIETAACKSTGKETADVQPDPAKAHGGAPAGNTNRVTHGMYASGLPRGAQRVARRVNKFRSTLEAAVVARAGEIDLCAAATINTACRWETVAQLAARWLRLNHDDLNHDQRLAYASKIAAASEARDKCLRLLKLDRSEAVSVWDALDARKQRETLEAAQ